MATALLCRALPKAKCLAQQIMHTYFENVTMLVEIEGIYVAYAITSIPLACPTLTALSSLRSVPQMLSAPETGGDFFVSTGSLEKTLDKF